MSVGDDKNMMDRADQEFDDLLAQDRNRIAGVASERIASGMLERIAHAHAVNPPIAAWKWQRRLVLGAIGCVTLVAVWFAIPRKIAPPQVPSSAHLPVLSPSPAQSVPQPVKRALVKNVVGSPGSHFRTARTEVPRQATFPINVAATEQERLLMRLAAQHPEQLLALAEAMDTERSQEEKQKQEFEQWLQQRGGNR